MPKIAYQKINLRADSLALIETCNRIIDEYLAAGFVLTVAFDETRMCACGAGVVSPQ